MFEFDQNLSLWINTNQNKYFLIPINEMIPNGDFLISTILGAEKSVDINAITPFEITETAAKQYLETEIKQGLENVKIPITEIIESSFLEKPQIANEEEFIITLISKLTNSSIAEIEQHPELAQIGLQNLIQAFQRILNNSLTANSDNIQLSSQQLEILQDVFQEYGINFDDLLTEFPSNVQNLQQLSNNSAQKLSEKLQILSDIISNNSQDFSTLLLNIVSTYNQVFQDEENLPEIEAKKQQEQEQIIDKTIKDSLAKYPLPSLNFADLL